LNINDEKELTELLYHLTEELPTDETAAKRSVKRGLRIKEIHDDIKTKLKNGGVFAPSDLLRSYWLLMLFKLEYDGKMSINYEDIYQWIAFKEVFYEITKIFDDCFEFIKTQGRPGNDETLLLRCLGTLCRSHNSPTCTHRDKCNCNYIVLLGDMVEIRLSRNEEWSKRQGTERKNVFLKELKASKTAVSRFWVNFYGQKPPILLKKDIAAVLEYISIGDPSASTIDLAGELGM